MLATTRMLAELARGIARQRVVRLSTLNCSVNVGDRARAAIVTPQNDLNPMTIVTWFTSDLSNNGAISGKGTNGNNHQFIAKTSGIVEFFRNRVTTNHDVTTAAGFIIANVPNYVVALFDTTAGQVGRLLAGTRSEAVEASSYTTNTNGAGAILSDAGGGLTLGNLHSGNLRLRGAGLHFYAIFNRILSANEYHGLQWEPWLAAGLSGCVGCYFPGADGSDLVHDLSQVQAHAPITTALVYRSLLPLQLGTRRRWAPDATASGAVLQGAATISVTGTAALSTSIDMQGAATVIVSGTGALTTAIPLAGAATVALTGVAALSTSIALAAAATVSVTGAGSMTTAIVLLGAGTVTLTGSGSLSTAIRLLGSGTVTLTASGDLGGGAAALAGAGTIALTAVGALTTAIVMSGAASVTLTGTGSLSTLVRLAGVATISITGSGTLTDAIAAVVRVIGKYAKEHAAAFADISAAEAASYAADHASALKDITEAGA